MRGHLPITLALKAQGNGSVASLETREANIFTLFPLALTGTLQVETATAAGTVSAAGNATATVTGAGITGSPVAIPFAVEVGDTPTLWAAKAAAAINANAAVSALYLATSSGTSIILTAKTAAANDATLNVALATGTATGITTAATSGNTLGGVATGVGLSYTIEGKSPNGEWHTLVATVALTTAGAKDAVQLSTFCDEIRVTLSSWTNGQLTITGHKAIRA
jgi:hypothetical protein